MRISDWSSDVCSSDLPEDEGEQDDGEQQDVADREPDLEHGFTFAVGNGSRVARPRGERKGKLCSLSQARLPSPPTLLVPSAPEPRVQSERRNGRPRRLVPPDYATRSCGSRPAKTAPRLSRARKATASRVSAVALPMWGRAKTLGSRR